MLYRIRYANIHSPEFMIYCVALIGNVTVPSSCFRVCRDQSFGRYAQKLN